MQAPSLIRPLVWYPTDENGYEIVYLLTNLSDFDEK